MKKEEIIKTINEKYADYEGYVQFSHRPINLDTDVFKDGKRIEVSDESGFIYEAHFYNGVESVAIRQINDAWHVATTQLSEVLDETNDIQEYDSIVGKVKMAQIWKEETKEETDELCENMPTKKLKKVVFAGFGGEE